jgi:DNA-binding response OmpR family regulator
MFPDARKHRALLIGGGALADELRPLLNNFGYFVEHDITRLEGARRYRARRHSLVVVDADALRGAPDRFFRFFRTSGGGAIVLIASGWDRRAEASRYLRWGAHDVIHLPLRPDALSFILGRASAYHRRVLRAAFLRNAMYFGLAMSPLWALFLYFVLK